MQPAHGVRSAPAKASRSHVSVRGRGARPAPSSTEGGLARHGPAKANEPLLAADVLALQRSAGNQAVLHHLRRTAAPARPAGAVIQRKETGLKQSSAVSSFATDAVAYYKDKANKDKPLNELGTYLMDKVNAELKALGSEACIYTFDGSGIESGSFFRVTWSIKINPAQFSSRSGISKVGELTVDEAAEVADTLYHEARHSEQYFRIARMLAGESKETSVPKIAAEIVDKLSIPATVATAAAGVPLNESKANAGLIAEARDWQSITIGIHEEYKGNINDWIAEARAARKLANEATAANLATTKTGLDTQITAWQGADRGKFVDAHIATVEAIKNKGKMDKLVLKHLKAIQKLLSATDAAWKKVTDGWAADADTVKLKNIAKARAPLSGLADEVYAAYRDHLHEKDAWETGARVGAAFRKKANKK